jgi:hypothetical protein
MTRTTLVWKAVEELRPYSRNRELYGRPTDNSAYKDILYNMKKNGFDERYPLLITADGRILGGVTRHHAASKAGVEKVPCIIFQPSADLPELECDAELLRDNTYRSKTQVMLAREQRLALEVEKGLARARMGAGSDGGPSKSTDRVGKMFNVSGKTVARRIKVLEAIEQAEADGDSQKAKRLTELLEANKVMKARDVIAGKPAAKKPSKVERKQSLLECSNLAVGEFYEACARVAIAEEVKILERALEQMHDSLRTARAKLDRGQRGR